MSRRTLPVIAFLAAGITAPILGSSTAQADPDCRPLVIGLDGTSDHAARAAGIKTGVDYEMDRYAANGAQIEHPDYPATIYPDGSKTFDQSDNEGAATVKARVNQYYADCPDGHVTLIGHSQGADVMGNVGQQLQAEGDTHGTTVVLQADPRHPGQGFLTTWLFDIPGINMGERTGQDLPDTTRICHYYDIVCNSHPLGDPVQTLQAFWGYLVRGDHGYWPGEADDNVGSSTDAPTAETPIPLLPGSLPTGLVDGPPADVFPVWEPGNLPTPFPDTYTTFYTPTPAGAYVPDVLKPFVPQQILEWVPPPLPTITLPVLPALPALPVIPGL